MINFDDIVSENKTAHNKSWPYILDHPCRILIIGGSGFGKANALSYLIENQPDIDKIYLYGKYPNECKYQYLINKREGVGINYFEDLKALIKYSNDMRNVYKNINHYNPDKENKILIVLDDMIADMIQNKKLNSIVTKLFIRGRNLNISFVFINQSFFKVPKDVRLNTTHFVITKILSKRELQQIAINHSSDITTEDFINIYKKCTAEPYSFFINNTTLKSDNPLRFRKNLFVQTIRYYIAIQYDINRETTKISALSSGKIHKYEYLTGEDILPSSQQQIIEQTKFTYSPLGKAFEKQIKTIEDQGQKQVDALENLKDQNKQLVNVNNDYEDKLLHSKEQEIFRNNYNKRLDKAEELTKKIDGNELIFAALSTGEIVDFSRNNDPLTFL